VCTYWGKTELNLKVSKQWGFDDRSDFSSKYTIYVESQSADRLCLGLDNMAVDPHTEGNLARWINCSCSPDEPNLEPRLISVPNCDHPVIGFYAAVDIACGTELRWKYKTEATGHHREAGGKVKYHYSLSKAGPGQSNAGHRREMVRDLNTGNQHAGKWLEGFHYPWGVPEALNVQGICGDQLLFTANNSTEDSSSIAIGSSDHGDSCVGGSASVTGLKSTGAPYIPTKGPWFATILDGQLYDSDGGSDADDEEEGPDTSERYQQQTAYWEPFAVYGDHAC
jgi:hypothetical protein